MAPPTNKRSSVQYREGLYSPESTFIRPRVPLYTATESSLADGLACLDTESLEGVKIFLREMSQALEQSFGRVDPECFFSVN